MPPYDPRLQQAGRALRTHLALLPVAWAIAALLQGQAWAQSDGLPAPVLRPSTRLGERISDVVRPQLPIYVEGDSISGRTELETTVEGNAVMRRGDTVIRADRLDYYQPDDMARARGNVRINRAGNIFEGPLLELKVDAFEGFFTQPRYRFLANGAYGQAERIDFVDEQRAVIHRATYTTCERPPGDTGLPAWILTADRISVDNEEEIGRATGALVRFFGVPVLPVPSLTFPLSDRRKSGLLPPTFSANNRNGLELTLPYYWNIAPNRDATFYPTFMSRRGFELGGEFRYLERDYRGTARAAYLPSDQVAGRDRWAYSLRHDQAPFAPGNSALSLNLNRVSDDAYWKDFPNSRFVASLTQRLLPTDAIYTWGPTGDLVLQARALKWQTLQDVTAPIVPPYDRLPQIQARYTRSSLPLGLSAYVETDYTSFHSDRTLTLQPDGKRSYVMGQLSRPWLAPGWFFTPKIQWHATQYQFDAPLIDGSTSAQRTVPTFSLDGGLIFERAARFLGRDVVQTLEPRAFFVNTPLRDQSRLPNYDSAQMDFNFATIYTQNSFVGNDRIADNKLLTLGVTSRLQDAASGAQLARFGIAQRLRFEDQLVTLPGGTPVVDRLSDVLLGASTNWTPQWVTDGTLQYNPKTRRSERVTLGARYNPTPYRVVNAAYRLQRGLSEQIDIGWQWPLNDLWGDRGRDLGPGRGQGGGRWYSVGRLNLSLKDRRVVDAILGLEYDGCCWIGRVVLERVQAGTSSNKRILFQLEFLGLTRLGSNALGALRDNIPRYQFLRDQVEPPSRYTQYD